MATTRGKRSVREIQGIIQANFGTYISRRGGQSAGTPPSERERLSALREGFSLLGYTAPENAGSIQDGFRLLEANTVAVFVSDNDILNKKDKFEKVLKAAVNFKDVGVGKRDVVIVGMLPSLKVLMLKFMRDFPTSNPSIRYVKYLPHLRFLIDVQKHCQALPLKHEIITPETADREVFVFYRRGTDSLSRLLVKDPQCVWLGAKAGDIVRLTEVTSNNTHNCNYFFLIDSHVAV